MQLSRDQVEDRLLTILDGTGDRQEAAIEDLLAQAPEHRELLRRALAVNREFADLCARLFGPAQPSEHATAPRERRPDEPAHQPAPDDPEQIGPYTIRQWLGAGGMGTVYLAERNEPLHQRVALKVIKRGMDSALVLARFEAERQVLAAMDHPAIARVLDAGTAADGRPYFAMEYIDGEPITTFCDRHRLSLQDRLGLFLQVCYGVQHAHGKGVVHRDLKPGNVLVSERDGERQVKIIDFGVAKALFGPLGRTGMLTVPGQVVGTPEYMSPEQAEGRDVDAATDVYALGAILYELLVGARPFDRDQLLEAGWNRIAEVLRNTPAPRPSTRLHDRAFARLVVARRNTEFRALLRELRGDLDWVVMRAIEPDRERRYLSPSELAADVLRYLQGEVVSAGRPSVWHRLRKLARRHRAACAAIVTGVASLALGLAAALVFLREARHYRGEVLSRDAQIALASEQISRATALREEAARAQAQAGQVQAERDLAVQRASVAASERDTARADAVAATADTRAAEVTLAAERATRARMSEEIDKLQRGIAVADAVASTAARGLAEATARADRAELALTEARARAATLESAGVAEWLAGWLDRRTAMLQAELSNAADAAGVSMGGARRLTAAMTAARWLLARDDEGLLALRGLEPGDAVPLRARLDALAIEIEAHAASASRAGRTLAAHAAHGEDWERAQQRIRRSHRYGRFDLRVQFGLIPLGVDREGRECFWHVATGARPERDDDGAFRPRAGDGAILVLMPAGVASLGAQRPGPGRDRNLDPHALPEEGPPHEVVLAPYFVGLDVLTVAQWQRLSDDNSTATSRDPAVGMTWAEANTTLARGGLVLPTEARWEAACRAGVFGADGRVAQWCLDRFATYGVDPVSPGNGARRASNPRSTGRAVRGGCPALPAELARVAARNRRAAAETAPWLGVRAAREVLP